MHRSAAASFGSVRVRLPHAEPGQRIGLLGGSFNPPHAGHRLISEIALRRLGLDRVWWIVTPGNPLKRNDGLPSLADRMQQCRQLAADPRIIVTGFECGLRGNYTVDAVGFLKRRLPGVHFVWLMGADNLVQFDHWRRWRDIFSMMPVVAIDRPGWHLRAISSKAARTYGRRRKPESQAKAIFYASPPRWTFVTGPLSPLSSTALRERPSTTGPRSIDAIEQSSAVR